MTAVKPPRQLAMQLPSRFWAEWQAAKLFDKLHYLPRHYVRPAYLCKDLHVNHRTGQSVIMQAFDLTFGSTSLIHFEAV